MRPQLTDRIHIGGATAKSLRIEFGAHYVVEIERDEHDRLWFTLSANGRGFRLRADAEQHDKLDRLIRQAWESLPKHVDDDDGRR